MGFGIATQTGVSAAIQSIPSLSSNKGLRNGYGATFAENFTDGTNVLDPRITFSRASNATVTGSDGLIQYAPHNLLTFSEQFDASVWSKINSTVTANATTAPNGTTTADLFSGTGTSAAYLFTAYAAVAGVPFYLSCHVKNFSLTGNATVWIRDFTEVGLATFDLATGTVNSFSGIASEATIVDVGNGWYRISAKFTPTTTGNHNISPVHIGTAAPTTGFYAWGAQLNVGSLQSYNPTTVKNLLGFSEAFDNAAWTKSNSFIQTNLLTFSEQFDNAAWIKASVTVTANNTTAPDGTATADKIITANGSAFSASFLYQAPSKQTSPTKITISIYAKAGEFNAMRLFTAGANTSTARCYADFNLATGEVTSVVQGTSGFDDCTAAVTSAGSGWYRCSITFTSDSAATVRAAYYPRNTTGSTGDGVSGIYIWGAQLVQGSVAGDYQQTTSVALPVMYQDPNGTMTADKLVENTVNAGHTMDISTTVISGTTYTTSIYAKAGERTQFSFRTNSDNTNATFNLSAGTIGTVTNGTGSITAVGNGWYRCSLTWAATSSASVVSLRVRLLDGSGNSSYTGDGTSGIYIWGAQLSDSASLDQYVNNPVAAPSSTAYYGPRFDYDPVTLQPKGLLIEEQRTNTIRNNSGVGAVVGTTTLPTNWTFTGGGLTATVVASGVESGINYLDIRFAGTASSGSSGLRFEGTAGVTASTGQTWANTCYIRMVGGSLSGLSGSSPVGLNLTALVSGTGTDQATTNITLAELSVSSIIQNRTVNTLTTVSAGVTAIRTQILFGHTIGNAVDITLRIGFPQLELGAFPTSVIPTANTQVTRSADIVTIVGSNFSSFYNPNEGTLAGQYTKTTSQTTDVCYVRVDNGGESNRIQASTGASFTVFNPFIITENASQGDSVVSVTQTGTNKFATAFAFNSLTGAVNATIGATDSTINLPNNIVRMSIGNSNTTSQFLNGWVRQVAYYPRRLQNSELQAITL